MNLKKLEKEVKENSIMLEKTMSKYIKSHKNKYIIFNKNEIYFANNLKSGVNKGINKFGENTGFVVKKVTNEIAIVSSLVTI